MKISLDDVYDVVVVVVIVECFGLYLSVYNRNASHNTHLKLWPRFYYIDIALTFFRGIYQ